MGGGAHVPLLPFPVQGHICPMVEYSKHLASKRVRVTIVIPTVSADCSHQVHEAVARSSTQQLLFQGRANF
ncbi:hypothetical protein M0R45_025545 [Rubus argutus]|uniref:Uncharacterized protein n=1 Tax=Rubus argutus TaxID=59490 RepID=A0AAW1WXH7_RUBAR